MAHTNQMIAQYQKYQKYQNPFWYLRYQTQYQKYHTPLGVILILGTNRIDGATTGQRIDRGHSNATSARQAGRQVSAHTPEQGTRHSAPQAARTRLQADPPPQGTSGDQFEENYPKRCSPKILAPIKRRP